MMCMNQCDFPDEDGGPCRCEMDARNSRPKSEQETKMNADEILKALQSGKLSEQALRVVSRAVYLAYMLDPISWQPFIEEIQELNKTTRQQVDDHLRKMRNG